MEKDKRFADIVYDMAEILDRKKAEDIVIIDVRNITIIADTFMICSGRSTTHVRTLADELDEAMAAKGIKRSRVEGYAEGRWIVEDYGDILVHIFHKEEREFYGIERLWQDGTNSLQYEQED